MKKIIKFLQIIPTLILFFSVNVFATSNTYELDELGLIGDEKL